MWHRPFRFAVGVCTLLLTAHATAELARVLSPQGDNAIELLGIALFAPCFAWTTFGALIGVLGLFAVPFSKRTRSLT
ncbi:MAG TPA: hypothetical protein VMK12_16530, partial [Anaeromyxobacteraceae bacterium]|nr:hypothetical protein [Anaeromyxobacteraceae bacterium]